MVTFSYIFEKEYMSLFLFFLISSKFCNFFHLIKFFLLLLQYHLGVTKWISLVRFGLVYPWSIGTTQGIHTTFNL